MTRALVLDPGGLDALDALPREGIARVVVPFQVSPARRADVAARWPRAEVVVAPPASDGPWQAAVTQDLARIATADVVLHGVPLLDCFRASWRQDLALRRALEHGMGGVRRAVVSAEGGPAADLLRVVARRGGLDDVEVVRRPGAPRRRASLAARLRRAGPRGVALALASRLDPSGRRRAALRPAPRIAPARALAVSSYGNATRAAFEALASLGLRPALHVRTGPGALTGVPLPEATRSLALSSAVALDRREARRAVATAAEATADRLARLGTADAWCPWPDAASTSFRRALAPVLLPEVAAGIVGLARLVERTGCELLAVGDEFSYVDRAALHVARAQGRATVSRQHGILDSHYRRDPVLADRHLAWDEATTVWLAAHGALGPGVEARVVPRRAAERPSPAAPPRDVAVFLQPLEMVGVPTADWMRETLPALARAAAHAGARLVGKPHPLQSRAAIEDATPAEVGRMLHLVTDRSAREVLASARVAVTLDSSVAVDCREAGVPCFSTAWYEGTYARDLARLGWVVPCATPEDLEARVRAALAPGATP